MHATNESMLSNETMLTNDIYSNGTKNETNVLNQMYLYWATDPRYLATTYLMFKIGKVQLYLLIKKFIKEVYFKLEHIREELEPT